MAVTTPGVCKSAYPLFFLCVLLWSPGCSTVDDLHVPVHPNRLTTHGGGYGWSPAVTEAVPADAQGSPDAPEASPVCGDGVCEDGESGEFCPQDCPLYCGDGLCDAGEGPTTCPDDCDAICGDGVCTPGEDLEACPDDCVAVCGDGTCHAGEDTLSCPQDCDSSCGDGLCAVGETPQSCPLDCTGGCGDGVCDDDETTGSCPLDCPSVCGDGLCSANGESAIVCPEDCPSICGDGACTGNEHAISCPADCQAACGDGVCKDTESHATCPTDCPAVCGDAVCSDSEDVGSCPADCPIICGDGLCSLGESCEQDCGPPPPPPLVSVFRHFYGCGVDSDHMFSHTDSSPDPYEYDGPAFELFSEPAPGLQPLYQSFCEECTDHFQTTFSGEGTPHYGDEQLLGYCSAAPSDWAPRFLQRMYHPTASDHVVTPKPDEIAYGQSIGYHLEGGCWVP